MTCLTSSHIYLVDITNLQAGNSGFLFLASAPLDAPVGWNPAWSGICYSVAFPNHQDSRDTVVGSLLSPSPGLLHTQTQLLHIRHGRLTVDGALPGAGQFPRRLRGPAVRDAEPAQHEGHPRRPPVLLLAAALLRRRLLLPAAARPGRLALAALARAAADALVAANTLTQLYYLAARLGPLAPGAPRDALLTHVVAKTFAGIGVLDLLHNTAAAFAVRQPPTGLIRALTGLGFGACLVYDLVALAVGQRAYGQPAWSNLLGVYAVGTAVIVSVRDWRK